MSDVLVIKFPGSAAEEVCDAYSRVLGVDAQLVWHDTETLPAAKLLVIPGGSSFADYLRPGALTRSSPVAPSIRRFCRTGRVLGIGNGFQVLCELGVLPGAHLINLECQFIAGEAAVTAQQSCLKFELPLGKIERYPLACEYGRYYCEPRLVAELRDNNQVVYVYCDSEGSALENPPTGSTASVAGVCNQNGNILGLMFHPERNIEARFGEVSGRAILMSALDS